MSFLATLETWPTTQEERPGHKKISKEHSSLCFKREGKIKSGLHLQGPLQRESGHSAEEI